MALEGTSSPSILFPTLWHERPVSLRDACLAIQNRLCASLPSYCAQINKAWYQAIKGRAFVVADIVGKDAYVFLNSLTHATAAAILTQTGLSISIPVGKLRLDNFILGKGEFGVVKIGFAYGQQKYVAIKTTQGTEAIAQEAAIQADLTGLPNLMQLNDAISIVGVSKQKTLHQVMPLAGLGSLKKIRDQLGYLDVAFRDQVIFTLAHDLFKGAEAMHNQGYCHLDLKSGNIVLTQQGEWLLIDYGCAQKMSNGQIHVQHTNGTLATFSPERWLGSPDLCDGAKIDGWALACILLEVVTEIPFAPNHIQPLLSGDNPAAELTAYYSTQLATLFSEPAPKDSLSSFLQYLFNIAPEQRPTLLAARQHPWFVKMQQQNNLQQIRDYLKECVQGMYRAKRESENILSPQVLPLPHFVNFIERPLLQKTLIEHLKAPSIDSASITICQGMGGSGKTQLANFILDQMRDHFGLKLWFRSGDQKEALDLQYFILARELHLVEDNASHEEVLQKLHAYLADYPNQSGKPWLMVIDNAGDPSLLTPYLPFKGGHILLTTRSLEWPDPIKIGVMDPSEAEHLVHRLLQRNEPDTQTLCKELGYLPLGIVQACAYMRNNQPLSIMDYITDLNSRPDLFNLDEKIFGQKLPRSISGLWQVTFDTLAKSCPDALICLDALAYISPDEVPEHLFPATTLLRPLITPEAKEKALQVLHQYALIERSASKISLHRLLQSVVRSKHSMQKKEELLKRGISEINAVYTWKPHSLEKITGNRQLFLHGKSLLSYCNALPLPKGLDEPFIDALLWLADLHASEGEASNQKALLEQSIPFIEKFYGQNHAKMALCKSQLGSALYGLGKPKEAKKCYEEALAIRQKVLDPQHPHMATNLNQLGTVCLALGEVKQARSHHEKALGIEQEVLGGDHPNVAITLNKLGLICLVLKNAQKALEYHEQALLIQEEAIKEKLLGAEHPNVAITFNHLGEVWRAVGDLEKAREFYEKALGIREKVLNPEHPDIVTSLHNLGRVLHELGKTELAISYLEKARACALKHPNVGDNQSIATSSKKLLEQKKKDCLIS